MVYLYIFLGSYVLFFFGSGLYVLIARNNVAAVYRAAGMSEESIAQQLATDEWKGAAPECASARQRRRPVFIAPAFVRPAQTEQTG